MAALSMNGHVKLQQLEVLQWARANDSPWDEMTCIAAISNGHVEVLEWVRLNGCPWKRFREDACQLAVETGQGEILERVAGIGCFFTFSKLFHYDGPAEIKFWIFETLVSQI
jgi:hypothetical protein